MSGSRRLVGGHPSCAVRGAKGWEERLELEELKSNRIQDVFQRSSMDSLLIASMWGVREGSRMTAGILV